MNTFSFLEYLWARSSYKYDFSWKISDSLKSLLEGTFIFSFIKPYHTNIRKEISKMPKVYINDFGLIKFARGLEFNNYMLIAGEEIENYVYNNLKNKFEKDYIYFYRTISKSEIDFVIKDENKFILVEAKFRNEPKYPSAIKKFSDEYQNINSVMIITKDLLDKKENVIYLPAVLLPFVDFDR
ncbi:MAG: DUF4143 domain-containing protein [Candidatus Firestonebacteria bacterium]|nr:DUF4143 domain-containing protein [Candidatus Firestonebacteria bacterium]